jgi:DNA repair protein RecO (recombination protein O)
LHCVTLTLQPLRPELLYALRPETGVATASGDEPGVAGARLVALQAALAHGSLDALRTECAGALPALRAGLRTLLQYHLGSPPLRTRQVTADVRRLLDPTEP